MVRVRCDAARPSGDEGEGQVARRGVLIEETIVCHGQTAGEATARLMEAVAGTGGYKAVQVGPSRLQFARTFRPTWAIVAGCATLVLALIGVFFFLVTTTETCTATIEEDHTGTRVRLSGRLDRDTLSDLRAQLESGRPAGGGAVLGAGATVGSAYDIRDAVVAPSTPRVIASAPGSSPATPAQPLPVAAPAPVRGSVAPPAAALRLPPPFVPKRTAAASARVSVATPPPVVAEAAPSVLALVFDDGARVVLGPLTLLGRDPSPAPGEDHAVLVPVDDPQRSVSKTHLAIGLDESGVWAVDRTSTNGTEIEQHGQRARLVPGERTAVPPGATLHLGGRALVLSTIGGRS